MLSALLNEAATTVFNPFNEHLPERMVVFGAGGRGRRCRARLELLGVEVPYLLDNDPAKRGAVLDGAMVLSPSDYGVRAAGLPVLVSSWAEGDIVRQLFALGIVEVYVDGSMERVDPAEAHAHAGEIAAVYNALADEQSRAAYADALRLRFNGRRMAFTSAYPLYHHPLVRPRRGDIIVDGGAAEGDTLGCFVADCAGDCTLHLFEPMPATFAALAAELARRGLSRSRAVNKALWSSETILEFVEEYASAHSNRKAEGGGLRVAATSLDAYADEVGLERVDFIKLDVEGAELEALRGAERTIRRDMPRLAVCLYHNSVDLWEIPLWLMAVAPGYSFFVGHHSCCTLDTVLYCAPKEN